MALLHDWDRGGNFTVCCFRSFYWQLVVCAGALLDGRRRILGRGVSVGDPAFGCINAYRSYRVMSFCRTVHADDHHHSGTRTRCVPVAVNAKPCAARKCANLVLALACGAADVLAEPVRLDREYEQCTQEHKPANVCVAEAYERLEARMMTLYRNVLKGSPHAAELKKSQDTWMKFRDAECAYVIAHADLSGTGWRSEKSICLIEMTKKRINALRSYRRCNASVSPCELVN